MPIFKVKKARIGDYWVKDDITGVKVHGSECEFGVDEDQGLYMQKNNVGEYNPQYMLNPVTDQAIPGITRPRSGEPWL